MKKFETVYFNHFKRPLGRHKVFKVVKRINAQSFVLMGLFVAVLVWFLLELFDVIDSEFVNIPFLVAVTLAFLVAPMVYIRRLKRQTVVFTERAILKQTFSNNVVMIPFDGLRRVLTDHKQHLVLLGESDKIIIRYKFYEPDLKAVDLILKYRGFFNDEPVAYDISFENNTVNVIESVEVMDDDTTQLFEKYIKEFNFLTPGFFEDIIFHNVNIESIRLTDAKHVVLYLSHLDIKPTHPENTHFAAFKSSEAIVIFENVQDIEVIDIGSKKAVEPSLNTIQALREATKNAVIFEAATKPDDVGMMVEFVMSRGAGQQRIRFAFTQAIVGWNALIEESWFEKKV